MKQGWNIFEIGFLKFTTEATAGRQVVGQVKKVGKSINFHQKVGKSRNFSAKK